MEQFYIKAEEVYIMRKEKGFRTWKKQIDKFSCQNRITLKNEITKVEFQKVFFQIF